MGLSFENSRNSFAKLSISFIIGSRKFVGLIKIYVSLLEESLFLFLSVPDWDSEVFLDYV